MRTNMDGVLRIDPQDDEDDVASGLSFLMNNIGGNNQKLSRSCGLIDPQLVEMYFSSHLSLTYISIQIIL
jgi:hypothetical protein